jgi:DNA-binding Lrp family transcriptional regulator
MGDWTFFSNYGHVLVCLARDGRARLRDVAREVGITERAVQKIVKDMQTEGFIEVRKQGRCNRYRINRRKVLRHPLESHCTVGKLLALIAERGRPLESVAERAEDPKPTPESIAEPGPVPQAATERGSEDKPKPEAEPKPEPKRKPKASKESEPGDGPIDIEQQGSLF